MAGAILTPDRWEQVKKILETVLERPAGERVLYLEQACGADLELRSEVESLIAANEQASAFLKTLDTLPEAPAADFGPGQTLGGYQIVQKIGEGGMGAVYQALREDIRKLVAIKVVKLGMNSGFVLNRFLTERQILGHLDHPNVTKFLDSGLTPDGRPFFVMEFIAGEEIDAYCDGHRLNTRARLELFLKVCAGVEYAHRNLIVHRDVKPRNILVAEDGEPKLLDFGIAKILEEDPLTGTVNATVTMVRAMTPEYASPEQARGMPVSTATDVYSLGVLLYEMLTGHRPYRLKGRSAHEAAEVICHEEPVRPSTAVRRAATRDVTGETIPSAVIAESRDGTPARLERALSGDIDWIVLKALEKEPERRYRSVEAFANDIRRHLDGLPVLARHLSLTYRCGKFARRHKTAVIGAGLVALSLLVGIAATSREAHVANVQRERAERRFQDVRDLANSLLFELHDAIRDLPGSTPARELLVKRALRYLDSLNEEAGGDPGLARELASAYEKVGDVQGGYREANLGDFTGAIDSYRKALAIRELLQAENSGGDDLRRELVRTHGKLSDVLMSSGNQPEAMGHSLKLLVIAQKLGAANPASLVDRTQLASAYLDVGWKQAGGNDWQPGLENLRKSTVLFEQMAAEHPEDPGIRRRLAIAYDRTGSVISDYTTNFEEALKLHRKYLKIAEASSAADPLNADLSRIAAYAHVDIGTDLLLSSRASEARPHISSALTVFEKLAKADPKNAQYRLDVIDGIGLDADVAIASGHSGQAIGALKKVLALVKEAPAGLDRNLLTAMAQARMGRAYARLGKKSTAATWYAQSLPGLEEAQRKGSLRGRDLHLMSEARAGAIAR